MEPDVIVVVAFGQIITKEILEMPKYGCINVHASLLPAYRGAAPIQWAVMNGDPVSGVTIMKMDEGIDTGEMLSKVEIPLASDETGGSLFDKLSAAGAKLLVETLPKIEKGEITPEKQPKESTTAYARMIKKEDGRIDWTKSAIEIERQIRAMSPWPSAFTKRKRKKSQNMECEASLPCLAVICSQKSRDRIRQKAPEKSGWQMRPESM